MFSIYLPREFDFSDVKPISGKGHTPFAEK